MRQRIDLHEFASIVISAVVLLTATISLVRLSPTIEANPSLPYCIVFVSFVLIQLLSIVLHELGHALVVRWFRCRLVAITIGSGRPILHMRLRGTEIRLSRNFLGGGGLTTWDIANTTYVRRCLVTGAGPSVNVMVALAAFASMKLAPQWICLLIAGVNLGLAVMNLTPHVARTGRPNDGQVIRTLLRDRPAPITREAATRTHLERIFQQAEHDPEPLLAWAKQVLGALPSDSATATEVRRAVVYALSRAGRFAEASRTVRGDRSPGAVVLRADMQVTAMLFGQTPTDSEVLSEAVEVLEEAQSSERSDGPRAAVENAGLAHGLAVARLVQGRPAEARALLPEVQLDAQPSILSALDATRGIACAHLGQREESTRLLGVIRSRTPESPWINPLENALGLAATR